MTWTSRLSRRAHAVRRTWKTVRDRVGTAERPSASTQATGPPLPTLLLSRRDQRKERSMLRHANTTSRLIIGGLGLLCAGAALAPAQDAGKKPFDFSAGNGGWVTIGTD